MKKRLLSAMLLLPALPIMYLDLLIPVFHLLILTFSLLATWEIFHMAKIHRQGNLRTIITTMAAMVLGHIIIICGPDLFRYGNIEPLYKAGTYAKSSIELSLLIVFILISILFAINMIKVDTTTFEQRGRAILVSVFTFIYLGLGFWKMSVIRLMPEGRYIITMILLCAWVSDAGAMLFGKKIGKHKMLNSASPNKTYEGLVGMFFITVPVVLLFDYLSKEGVFIRFLGADILDYSTLKMIGLTILFSFIGFLGDMGESIIKRMYDTKDSSKMLPGHGGIFDRFDSVILITPIAYYIFKYLSS